MTSQLPQKQDFVMNSNFSKGFLDNYLLLRELGRGFNAKVYQGVDTKTGRLFAIKRIKDGNAANAKAIINEIKLMNTLHHPNITAVHGLKEGNLSKPVSTKGSPRTSKPTIYSVMDLESGGEMFHFLKAMGRFPESVSRYYFCELLKAVAYCHEIGVSHRDIKPENILFSNDFHLKLIDFGFAIGPNGEDGKGFCHSILGSLSYMAPEIFSKQYKAPLVDAFACGVVLFLMHTGKFPHRIANSSDKHYGLILKGQFSKFWKNNEKKFPPGHFSAEFTDLVSGLLHSDPNQRLTVERALKHSWVCKETSWTHETISQFMGKFAQKAKAEMLVSTAKKPKEEGAEKERPLGQLGGKREASEEAKELCGVEKHLSKKTQVN